MDIPGEAKRRYPDNEFAWLDSTRSAFVAGAEWASEGLTELQEAFAFDHARVMRLESQLAELHADAEFGRAMQIAILESDWFSTVIKDEDL